MRLDKFLADAGIGSRSQLRGLIRGGRVAVNGTVCKSADAKVVETDRITLDGEVVAYEKFVTVMINKPEGYLSATADERGDKIVTELLDERLQRMNLKPAGRLDKDSTGLLVLTNNGALIHSVISPTRHVLKRYEVTLASPLPADAGVRFAEGITLEDGYRCLPGQLVYEPGALRAVICIREGKFHQVKRMVAALGSTVLTLHRAKIGALSLDETLQPGEYRRLTDAEIALLLFSEQ
ncbi:MAG: rRNA pseudouridine synthase [Clostridia bacterium]|nr:rRNA pseudouridine synthase [Clostridia bacterium]